MPCNISIEDSFGPQVIGCLENFDFTLLFEETILSIAPQALILLLLPGRISNLLKQPRKVRDGGLLRRAKLASYTIFALVQLTFVVSVSLPRSPRTRASIACAIINLICTLAIWLLSHLEHTCSVRPSVILNNYLLFSLLCDIIRVRTLWAVPDNLMVAIVFTASVVLKSVLLVLESIEKRDFLLPDYINYPPEATAGVYSRNFFWWLCPLLIQGFKRELYINELDPNDKVLIPETSQKKLQERWDNCDQTAPHSLLWVYIMHYKRYLAAAILPRICLTGFRFAQPFLVSTAVTYIASPTGPNSANRGYGLIVAYAIVYIGIALTGANSQHKTYRVITMARGTLVNLIYQKTLELSTKSIDESKPITLMSADVERIGTGLHTLHELWASCIEIGLALWLIQGQMGYAMVAAALVTFLCTGAAVLVASGAGTLQNLWLGKIQSRVESTTSMLGSIKGIKMSGLTNDLSAKIQALREEEIASSYEFRKLLVRIVNLSYMSTAMAPMVSFGVFSVIAMIQHTGGLNTDLVSTSLTLFELLAAPVALLIETLAGVMTAVGSFQRIGQYLATQAHIDRRITASHSEEMLGGKYRVILTLPDEKLGITGLHPDLETDVQVMSTEPWYLSGWDGNRINSLDSLPPEILRDTTQRSSLVRHRRSLVPVVPKRSSKRVFLRSRKQVADTAKSRTHRLNSRDTEIAQNCMVVRISGAGWDSHKSPILHNLNFEIKLSQVTMVIGPVGCGKSTLLKTILGETPFAEGIIEKTFADVAYCSQTPWLINGTIQRNILGTSEMDENWYNTVTRACALDVDLKQLPGGDKSMVGSKGITLSGGQQMRLTLARAVYSRKPVVVLDDVFSGLDSATEESIFAKLFGKTGLFSKQETTVVLATNAVHRLYAANYIIALGSNGHIVEQGSFEELNSGTGYIRSFSLSKHENPSPEVEEPTRTKAELPGDITQETPVGVDRRTGDFTVYEYYISSFGWWKWSLLLFFAAVYGFCTIFPTVWAQWWGAYNMNHPNGRLGYYLGIYALIAILSVLALFGACWHLVVNLVPLTARKMHSILLKTVLNAPLSFFAKTDTGITINRFSQDLELIDMELPLAVINVVLIFAVIIAQALVIAVTGKYVAVIIPFCIGIVYFVQNYYLRTSRQLRLLEIEAKSPLFSHFLETLGGLATIRAFGWGDQYLTGSRSALELSQRPYYLLYCVQRWLSLVLDLVVAGIAIILITIGVEAKSINSSLIGLALVNVVSFSTNLKSLITNWTILETSIGAISRVRSFESATESENLQQHEEYEPPHNWPEMGAIEFKNVSATYKSAEKKVLNSISLKIKGGQRIGICGRSGSGKSSFVLTLFRMLDLEAGNIYIDGIDVRSVSRQEVRSRLTAIPQEPYLLTGNVRLNVDPFQNASDDDIISALDKVHLWDLVKQKGGLDAELSTDFFSHGQRQLICLARAIIRKGRILILDEATSSVDIDTDKLMQEIIRSEFPTHTIIAIAHRLDTVLDFDMVAVLGNGELVEFEPPGDLLARPSAFRELYAAQNPLLYN